jgi:hypothetical protein
LAFYERAEEILVSASYYYLAIVGSTYRFWWWQCLGTFYLYTFLKRIFMKKDTSKSTILIISMGFLILYFVFHWQWAIFVSLFVGLIGIISPFLSRKIEWVWMKLAYVMGMIVPNILLGLIFYFFLFPISLIYRQFNKDPLMLSNKHKTYFIEVNKESDKKSFEKIW